MPEQKQTLTIQQAMDLAVQHHNAGDLTKAEGIYKQILQSDPDQHVALHLLGVIAHQTVLRNLGHKVSTFKFGHRACHALTANLTMIDSYHCSRLNTNTGRLTEAMFHDVFDDIRELVDEPQASTRASLLLRSRRCLSRFQSRSFSDARLSCLRLPLAMAISTLARPRSLK